MRFRRVQPGMRSSGTLNKTAEICFVNNTAVRYCDNADQRSFSGDWFTGFNSDGTIPSVHAAFNAVTSGSDLVLNVRKNLVLGTRCSRRRLHEECRLEVVRRVSEHDEETD